VPQPRAADSRGTDLEDRAARSAPGRTPVDHCRSTIRRTTSRPPCSRLTK
jgi:hypothetical protein